MRFLGPFSLSSHLVNICSLVLCVSAEDGGASPEENLYIEFSKNYDSVFLILKRAEWPLLTLL